MRIISVVQNLDYCTAYLKDGSAVRYPVDTDEADQIFKAIPQIAAKGYADIDIVKSPECTTSTLGDALGVQLFTCLTEIAKRLQKEPELIKDIEKIQEKYLGKLAPNQTLVAKKDGKILTGLERLEPYLKKAHSLQQYKGLKALVDRCFAMAEHQEHSVEDLLKFLEYADLPIADDGGIIAYKMVDKQNGYFVDCHTHKVKQDVRYQVFMDPNMVDPDRSTECSQGLHIARRAYLKNFRGEACLLVKFAPEAVIAVPYEDANKIRVCSYEILAVLPDECKKLIEQDMPMTSNPQGKKLLAKAIGCKFPPACLYTEITGPLGEGCRYGEITDGIIEESREVSDREASAFDEKSSPAQKAQAKKKVKEAQSYNSPIKKIREIMSKKKVSKKDFEIADALRKKLKKSWKALGYNI